jgi:GNAT superfamily N-acetyltransferase
LLAQVCVACHRLYEQGFFVTEGRIQADPIDPIASVRSASDADSYPFDAKTRMAASRASLSRKAVGRPGGLFDGGLTIFTRPAVRGRGLAGAATAAVVAELLAAGCRDVILNVARATSPARRVYARLGFRVHTGHFEGLAHLSV